MITAAQTADDLRAAARYIEKHGWTTGRLEGPDGSVCAIGSINAVVGLSPRLTLPMVPWTAGDRRNAAMDALIGYIGRCSIGSWNDYVVRTKEDVIEALEKAAARIEEQA